MEICARLYERLRVCVRDNVGCACVRMVVRVHVSEYV